MLGTVKNSIIKKIFPCTLAKHFSDCFQPSKNILSDYDNQLTLGAPTEALSGQIGSVKVGEHTVQQRIADGAGCQLPGEGGNHRVLYGETITRQLLIIFCVDSEVFIF